MPANQLGFSIPDTELHARGYQKRFRIINVFLGFMIDKSKYKDKKTEKWTSIKNMYVNGTAYGGLIGNAKAFSVYLQELLKTHNRLISEEHKKMLFTENILENGKPTNMCLSWFKGELIHLIEAPIFLIWASYQQQWYMKGQSILLAA